MQVGGPRPGQPADDDRGHDPLLEDLGVAPHEVLEEEPVLQQSRDEDVLLQHARPVEAALLPHGPAQDLEALHEVVGARSRRAPSRLPPLP